MDATEYEQFQFYVDRCLALETERAELERKLVDAIASKNTALDNLTVAHAQIEAFIGKLAEQQAVIYPLSPATKESGNGCNELTTLLAAEYQRCRADERAEAVEAKLKAESEEIANHRSIKEAHQKLSGELRKELDEVVFKLNEEDSAKFLGVLDNPPEPSEELIKAAREYAEKRSLFWARVMKLKNNGG